MRFSTAHGEDGDLYDAAHLAQLTAALGPPLPVFLARNSERKADLWDEQLCYACSRVNKRKASIELLLTLTITGEP